MTLKRFAHWLLVCVSAAMLLGCQEYGKVDQGRVIKFDKEAKTVTLIQDKKAEPSKPDYSALPPHSYTLPKNPAEMGPEPKAGLRMKLDTEKNEIIIFDVAAQNFKTIAYTPVDKQEKIAKDHPLVKDKKFPAVDKEKKTITIYSGRQKMLVTISVPDEYMDLPVSTWDAGDEVRIYYKEEGVALRFMNISKTDIFKK